MTFTTIDHIGLILLALGLLGLLYLLVADRRGRQKKLSDIAKDLNGTFLPGPISDYDGCYKWYELNIIEWNQNETPYRFYECTNNTNYAYTKYLQSYLKLELPNKLPSFKLLKYSLADSYSNDIQTDSEFKKYYNVYTNNVDELFDLFDESLRQHFIDNATYNIECDGNSLICYKTQKHVPTNEFKDMVQWLEHSYQKIQQAYVKKR